MSWLQKLHATYDLCAQNPDYVEPRQNEDGKEIPCLMPVSHTSQQAHICVTLDGMGNFQRAELLPLKTQLVIPATEDSAGRSGARVAPHPLIDKIHYCASEYSGKKNKSFKGAFDAYFALLSAWCDSEYSHPLIVAVRSYLSKGRLISDLIKTGILHVGTDNKLLTIPVKNDNITIFKYIPIEQKTKQYDQGDAIVCWKVITGNLEDKTWDNKKLQEQWIRFDADTMQKETLCMLSGITTSITTKHPRNIRRPGDGAKLISANDSTGFTFRGRFLEAAQACSIGYEASHKAHNALRWLLERQGYRNGDQAVLAWVESGAPTPSPCQNLLAPEDIDFSVDEPTQKSPMVEEPPLAMPQQNAGQAFSRRLSKVLRGYKQDLSDTTGVAILALDAASPGRLSVTFYREQMLGDYLGNLEKWQDHCAWALPIDVAETDTNGKIKKHRVFTVCAPTPDTIAHVAYGTSVDDNLHKTTVGRLLPCIVDATPLPRDLVESCVRRACNRPGLKAWEWPEVLGTACAVYKGFYARHSNKEERRTYTMALDEERRTRDYLYGRLLAVAEYVEHTALKQSGDKRPTNAERLMQRFADHPCATWKQLELHLSPYMQRLQYSENLGWLPRLAQKMMQEICDKFTEEEFTSSKKLSGEFLLGYHCQMAAFYRKHETTPASETIITEAQGENA